METFCDHNGNVLLGTVFVYSKEPEFEMGTCGGIKDYYQGGNLIALPL
jgi:hypothetical protein